MPAFCMVMFIVSLVFCGIRAPLVAMGFAGYFALQQMGNHPLMPTVAFEIGTGLGIVVFGIPGNALLLARQSWAVLLGYLAAASVVGSIAVGIWQTSIMAEGQAADSPERIFVLIGSGGAFVFRLVLLGLYVAALAKFSSWARQQTTGKNHGGENFPGWPPASG